VKQAMILTAGVITFILFIAFPPCASSESALLRKGVEQYKQENFEEAVVILKNARKEEPDSSSAAFFLGMAYKQTMDFPKAAENLRDAVQLAPRIKEALVELIDVLYRMGGKENLKEAHQWIETAEKENILPAKIAFQKGLVLRKEGKGDEAIKSFEKAKSLDGALSQSAEIQIAMTYVQEKELKKARDRFQAAVQFDPQSDLGAFARKYQDVVSDRIERERPLRATLGVFGGYDSNIIIAPSDSSVAAGDISDKDGYFFRPYARVDYVPTLKGNWLFNGQYLFTGNWYDNYGSSHDNITNGFYAAPGYSFGRHAINLAMNYIHYMVKSPSFEEYLQYFSIGPLYRTLLAQNHILELFASYDVKEYSDPPLIPEQDRDASGPRAYVGWIWTFKPESFLNLKYTYLANDADGSDWDNNVHTFTLNFAMPLAKKLQLQLGGALNLERYDNANSLTGFQEKREDDIYFGSIGLTWEFYKRTRLVLQASRTVDDSNIALYDYDRNIFAAGVEYRF